MTPGIPVGTKLTKMMTSFRMPEIVRKYISPVVPSSAKKPILLFLSYLNHVHLWKSKNGFHWLYFFVQIQNRSYARYADRCRDLASGFKLKKSNAHPFLYYFGHFNLSLLLKPNVLLIRFYVFGLNCLIVSK